MRARKLLMILAATGALLAAGAAFIRGDVGRSRFFANQTYHFQTLRVFNDIPAGGADTGEILQAIHQVRAGDAESWYAGWSAAAARAAAIATSAQDPRSRGGALLRAHNYLRTAQFLLGPEDPRRPDAFRRDRAYFYEALALLGVRHETFQAPYAGSHLDGVYYPAGTASAEKPLLVLFGGYDSTLEELYFVLVPAALERGYSVLTFEGPGQGGALREQGLTFLPQWERPTTAVLDAFLARHRRPPQIVLVGMSMGGLLAPRAAAFEPRIDGVVSYDVYFDMGETVRRYVPTAAFWLHDHAMGWAVEGLVRIKAAVDPDFAWAEASSRWAMGTRDALETVRAFDAFHLRDAAPRIRGDVLVLAGTRDHFVPLDQVRQYEQALTGARSVTRRIYDEASGGSEHCQLGASTLWQADLFDWLRERYGGSPAEPRSPFVRP